MVPKKAHLELGFSAAKFILPPTGPLSGTGAGSHGRGLSLFLCPNCGGKAQMLRLHDGRPKCRRCLLRLKIPYRIAGGTTAERAFARAERIEKLKAKLTGGPARLKPSPPRRTLDRRRSLELSLKRALIVARQDQLGVERR